jgi:dTDP-4-dehydrorhamnose reductase
LGLGTTDASGIVHAVNSGTTSWHGFASEIVRLLGAEVEVVPVTTEDFPRPAPRPAYSVLDTSLLASLLGRPMPPWQDALARYLGRE